MREPVWLVLSLSLLVLHYPALFVQLGLVDCAHHVTHPIRFHPEQEIQRIFGRVLEIIRAILAGCPV